MEEGSWHPSQIYEAWTEIHNALANAMTALPPLALAFLAGRAADKIIRAKAADALHSHDALASAGEDGAATSQQLRQLFRKHPGG